MSLHSAAISTHFDSIESTELCRYPETPSQIRPHTNGRAPPSHQPGLPSRTATSRPGLIPGIDGPAEHLIHALKSHGKLRQITLHEGYHPTFLGDLHEHPIFRLFVIVLRSAPYRGRKSPQINCVLDTQGNPKQLGKLSFGMLESAVFGFSPGTLFIALLG